MYVRLLKVAVFVLIVLLGIRATCAKPQPVSSSFETSIDGWAVIPPPGGAATKMSLVDEAEGAEKGKHALRAEYQVETGKMAGFIRPTDGLVGKGLYVKLKSLLATTVVLGLIEQDGSSYMHVAQTEPEKWLVLQPRFTSFVLSNDSVDENSRLDVDQVKALIVADASGFGTQLSGKQMLWMDEYTVQTLIKSAKPSPYIQLAGTGKVSASGARVTSGVTYPKGKFGQGMLADADGELAAVPIRLKENPKTGWNWEQGTIEMWVSPQFDMKDVKDFSGIVTMQNEPFISGLKGSILIFYTGSRQIAFMLNSDMQTLTGSKQLSWKKGEWHHIAASWGKSGMRFYVDGKLEEKNSSNVCPGEMSGDLVVGNHAWPLLSDKSSNTIIDELRLSNVQRSDAEIAAAARAKVPSVADKKTIALEHFDSDPLPPIRIKPGGAPFNAVFAGDPVHYSVSIPGKIPAKSSLTYTVATANGKPLRKGRLNIAQSSVAAIVLKPFVDQGFYRISFELSAGNKVVNKGEDWFRITERPQAASATKMFGASGCYSNFKDADSFFKYAAAAGVSSLRTSFEWSEIEPAEGKFVWDKYDNIVASADRYGVELIPTFIWEKEQPAWAGRGKVTQGFDSSHYPPEDMRKWDAFVYQVVNRYKKSIHWWIPANEPNLAKYWYPKPDAKAYVELLRATRSAALRADASAKILGFSVSGMDLAFLEECFKEGGLELCDAVGVHPYICPHSPDERIPINILRPDSQSGTFYEGQIAANALIRKYGGKHKLWLDESGQPYRNDFIATNWGVGEPRAAEFLAKIYLESMASGAVDRVLWFSFLGGEYGSFALVKPDNSPTLAMIAFIAASERLGGAEFAGFGERGKNIRSLIFKTEKDTIEILWSLENTQRIQLTQKEKAYDIYGFQIGGNSIVLSEKPVYIYR